jgi:hypothetical protein
MRGEGVRHPTTSVKKRVTSLLVFPLFAKPRFVGLCTNVPNLVVQYTKNDKCNLTSFGFD